ncbi:hypothetical protein [Granulicella arctica]|uniref:hypothetical protein n=1 Tax=Granulicella arctica TaxID=940613 RepID=UPI0021E01E73|nr:hypothetical protein [Granulicella arctica]
MLGSSILDVAIGMAFIYLLLSLIASTALEALSALIQARSANLEHGIRSLFSGGTLENGEKLVDLIYTHGLVRGLYRDPKQDNGATNIPDKLSPFRDVVRRILQMPDMQPIAGVSDKYLLPAYIPARTFAITIVDILNNGNTAGAPKLGYIQQRLENLCKASSGPQTLAADGTIVHSLCNNNAAEALRALLIDTASTAEGAIDSADKFRVNLENWYNDAMDRVSGWYKKRTQMILLVIGLALSVIFNVDSIRVGQSLWVDRDARTGLVNAAQGYITKNTVTSTDSNPDTMKKDLTKQLQTTVSSFNDVTSEYLLPVGWHGSVADYKAKVLDVGQWNAIHILEQLFGWIITGFALSLGAPFWFDLLNKFMVVRNTIKPQEKSKNEGSKD